MCDTHVYSYGNGSKVKPGFKIFRAGLDNPNNPELDVSIPPMQLPRTVLNM